MSLTLVQKGRRAPQSVSSAAQLDGPWYERDGSLVLTPIELAWANAGYVFVGNAGSVTTPITFGAGNLLETEPDFDLALPVGSSVKVVLLEIQVQVEAFGSALLWEGGAAIGLGGVLGSTGSTAVTPVNIRSDGGTSACSVVSNVDSAAATYMTSRIQEFWRFGQTTAITVATATDSTTWQETAQRWSARSSGNYPTLIATGAVARLNVWSASQAGTGFIRVTWAEIPIDA